ncbi:MAG: DNA mismatch repair endonuclease MutL, partial [Opitutales bacterium]|nr:DNA mismatch repair endonuclease MutL [Opitutales bacterium]
MKKTPPEIRILPDDVANRIAAGEVVERPAAVAKELIENSIDAGATRIEVEFKRGGKSFVKVSDDGCGMTRQQALTSLEPHATSKIRAPEDLFAISSYGFRGEAIPSIASVSKFRLRTRPESMAFGTEIDVYAGAVNSVRDCGMAAGTEISVENLFCSVPARRKFLKSDNVEASHIIRLCKLYALALPDISFTLVENSRVVFRSESGMDIVGRVGRIFGSDIAEKLFELPEISSRGISVGGAILKAGESFPTGRNICVFINGRPVDCRAAASAVKEAYSPYIPKGRFAAAFLFITLPPETVDVNVHPAKREVRLKNEFEVRDFLFDALSAALAKNASGGIADFQKNSISSREKFSFEKPASESPAPVPAPAFT